MLITDDYDGEGDGNKLATFRFLRLDVSQSAQYDVDITTTTAMPAPDDPDDARDQSDPDFYILGAGREVAKGESGVANFEQDRTSTLQSGETYAMFLEEWRFGDPGASVSYPSRICFDVSLAPTP